MVTLIVLGLLLAAAAFAAIRHSRGFRGSRSHFAEEDTFRGETSKGFPGPPGGA